jgi:hypothetical protein
MLRSIPEGCHSCSLPWESEVFLAARQTNASSCIDKINWGSWSKWQAAGWTTWTRFLIDAAIFVFATAVLTLSLGLPRSVTQWIGEDPSSLVKRAQRSADHSPRLTMYEPERQLPSDFPSFLFGSPQGKSRDNIFNKARTACLTHPFQLITH